MDAPLFDKDGNTIIGKFSIMAGSSLGVNINIRCAKCTRQYQLNGLEFIYIYNENKEVMIRDDSIIHIARWNHQCKCKTKMRCQSRIISTLQGRVKDQKFHQEGCEITVKPFPLLYRYVGEMGCRDPRI
jgi:hypothetical protein